MFSEIARSGVRRRVLRHSAYAAGFAAAELVLGGLLVVTYERPRASEEPSPAIEVSLLRERPLVPPRGLPPRKRARGPSEPKSPAKATRAMLQPKPAAEPGVPVLKDAAPQAPTSSDLQEVGAPGGRQDLDGVSVNGAPGSPRGGAPVAATPGLSPDFDEAMTAPKLLEGPALEYTPEALERRVEGLMVVRCVVTAEGTVRSCHILRGVPFMGDAVVSVLEGRRYQPATLNGMPLEVAYTFKIRLRLPR